MTDITSHAALTQLARIAVDALIQRHPVTLTHDEPYDRPKGWPLPMKATPPGQPRFYRPLAILEYVEYALCEQERAAAAAAKTAREVTEVDPARTFGSDYRADEMADNDYSDLI